MHGDSATGNCGDDQLFPGPLIGWRSGLPCLGDAAALLAQKVGVVGELVLEGQLVAGVLPGVVEFGSPYCEGTEGLGG
jgi:hypothetical protein